MGIIFVYNSKCARTTLHKLLNNGGYVNFKILLKTWSENAF